MSGSSQDPTNHYHQSGDHDGSLTAQVVTGQTDDELAYDFAYKESVGDTRAHGRRVLLLIFLLEDDVRHSPSMPFNRLDDIYMIHRRKPTLSCSGTHQKPTRLQSRIW